MVIPLVVAPVLRWFLGSIDSINVYLFIYFCLGLLFFMGLGSGLLVSTKAFWSIACLLRFCPRFRTVVFVLQEIFVFRLYGFWILCCSCLLFARPFYLYPHSHIPCTMHIMSVICCICGHWFEKCFGTVAALISCTCWTVSSLFFSLFSVMS